MVDHAPPPVRLGERTAVPIDIEAVNAQVAFDPANRRASAIANVIFTVGAHAGCPVLDLRQPVGGVALDGSSVPSEAFAHRDLGGGVGAEMRVLDRSLAAGSRHSLELRYRLATPVATDAQPVGWDDERAAVRFDFWMSDLHPGRYLEMWLPANLCHDRFALTVEVTAETDVPHSVVTNGEVEDLSTGRWRISYPDHFTSLSPMLVVTPAADLMIRSRPVRLAGRTEPVELVTAAPTETETDLAACEADIRSWLAGNAERYGSWAHGDRFTAFVWTARRGMEYDGATTASVGSLEHEVFHSWFGRGVKPARASDGWIDEAWTSWATSSRRAEEGRFAEIELGLDEPPVLLYPPNPWSRYTPTESYRQGARLFAGLAHLLGGAHRLREAMATWYRANVGDLITTDGLERHLSQWSGVEVGPWFERYVHGQG
jgi:hypothetical protein